MSGVDPVAVAEQASRLLAAHQAGPGGHCGRPCRDNALGPLHETVRARLGERAWPTRDTLAALCAADPAYTASLARAIDHARAWGAVTNTVVARSITDSTMVQTGTTRDVHVGDTHDRRGLYALLAVVVVLVVSTAVVAVLVTRPEEPVRRAITTPPVEAASDLRLKHDCESGWIVPDTTEPIPYTPEPPVDAVLATGGEVVVTVQGSTGMSVVLHSARVEVLGRTPARDGAYLPAPCQAEQPVRYFRVDLAKPVPGLVPVSLDGPAEDFPFRVSDADPEQFVITALSPGAEVEWRLRLKWSAGSEEGELVVDDDGKPFRTSDITAARLLCLADGGHQWQEPPC